MGGLRKICKRYGGMKVIDKDGNTIEYVWDHKKDEPVIKSDPKGKKFNEKDII